jgi:hypothetical protein
MTGGGGLVGGQGEEGWTFIFIFLFSLIFFIGLTCEAHLSKRFYLFAMSVFQVSPSYPFSCQFGINLKSMHIANILNIAIFLSKRKVVVF